MKPLEKLLSYLPAKPWLFLGYSAVVAWTKALFSSPILSGGTSHMSMHLWAMATLALFGLVMALFAGPLQNTRIRTTEAAAVGVVGAMGTLLVLVGSPTPSPSLIGAGYALAGMAYAWLLVSWQVEMAKGGIRNKAEALGTTSRIDIAGIYACANAQRHKVGCRGLAGKVGIMRLALHIIFDAYHSLRLYAQRAAILPKRRQTVRHCWLCRKAERRRRGSPARGRSRGR